MQFSWPIRVYYEDTDAGGVVYHSQYLNFMERARSEWLRHLGLQQGLMRDQYGILFVVRTMQIHFAKPARFDDALQVQTCLVQCHAASLQFEQQILKAQEVLLQAHVEVVCVDAERFKPKRIPPAFNTIFSGITLTSSSMESA